MSYLLEYRSDRSEIWNTYSIWSLDHMHEKSEFLQKFIFVLEQEIKISTRMKKFYFWVKYAVFIKNDRYSWRYDILNSYPFFGIALCCIVSIQNNVIPIG